MTLATGVRILERRSPAVRPGLLVIAVCLGGAMVGLDGSAITIAAPSIARSTHASLGDLTVIANVYLVMLAVCILPAGRLADRLGRRAGFIVGALGFAACSVGIGSPANAIPPSKPTTNNERRTPRIMMASLHL